MATVGQFNKVWENFTVRCDLFFLTDEAKAEIYPLFRAFKAEFEKQFDIDIQKSHLVPQDLEITGVALEKLKAWVERIKEGAGDNDYLEWCGLH